MTLRLWALGVLLVLPILPAGAVAREAPTLPAAVTTLLDRHYSGWRPGQVDQEVEEYFAENRFGQPPYLVAGDFDGDGRPDWAVKITRAGGWQVIVFLNRRAGWADYVLAAAAGPGLDIYLRLYRKGDRGFDFEAGKYLVFDQDSVEIDYFGKASVAYLFRGGKFEEIFTSD